MGLETGTYISDLNSANPVGSTDTVDTLDNHIRLIKSTLQASFPNITGAMTATHTELNYLAGVTPGTATASKALVLDGSKGISTITSATITSLTATTVAATNITFAGTAITASAAELNYNDIATLGTSQPSKVVTADANGTVSIAAPSSGYSLSVQGPVGNYATRIVGGATSGNSYGLVIDSGTTSADVALYVRDVTFSTQFLIMNGAGGTAFGSPAGGTPTTTGHVNAVNLLVNNNAVYYATGTDVPITDGGTGASTAAEALDNLGIDGSSGNIAQGDLATTIDTWNLITSGSASGNTTSLTGIASGYKELKFKIKGYYSNDNGHLWNFRFGDAGYETAYTTLSIDSASGTATSSSTYLGPSSTDWSTSADTSTNTFNAELHIRHNEASTFKVYTVEGGTLANLSATLVRIVGATSQAGEIDQIQVRCGTNGAATILGGTYELWGLI